MIRSCKLYSNKKYIILPSNIVGVDGHYNPAPQLIGIVAVVSPVEL